MGDGGPVGLALSFLLSVCLWGTGSLIKLHEPMPPVRSFRDLDTYQKAQWHARHIFTLTHCFPKEEAYSLTDQIRRSSRALGALLPEAWARRSYEAAFVNTLNQALAQAMETLSWLDAARDCGYIDTETHNTLDTERQRVGDRVNRMIQHSDRFCQSLHGMSARHCPSTLHPHRCRRRSRPIRRRFPRRGRSGPTG